MKPLHMLLAAAVALSWGFNYLVSKIGVLHFPPLLFAGLRFVLVLLLLAPFLRRIPRRLGMVVAIGLTTGAGNFGLTQIGFALTEHVAPIAILFQISVPLLVVLAVVFLGEKVGIWRTTGTLLGFAGVMILGFDPKAFTDPLAMLFVFAGAFSYSVSVILVRRYAGGHPLELQAWTALVSAPALLLGSLLFEEGQMASMLSSDWQGWAAVAYAAIAATVIGHGSSFYLLNRYSVAQMVPVFILTPVLGVFFGVWLNDDPMTSKIALGGIITFTGVAIIQVRDAMAARRSRISEAAV